jgi:putative endonuclease
MTGAAGDTRRGLGRFGEQFARQWLEKAGFVFVEAGWRCTEGEIDLVMRDGLELVFVEVRARRGDAAVESIGVRKQARLARLAYSYLSQHALPEATLWRIDVVALQLDRSGRIGEVIHIPNAIEE